MAQSITQVQANYIQGMQLVSSQIIALSNKLNNLINLYNGAALSGTFTDAEVQAVPGCAQLTAALIGTYTSNLESIQTAISSAIIQNLCNCIGQPQ
jgi:hypothetical protein